MTLDPRSIARALGGEVSGRHAVLAPGPGHSGKDRSLSVRLDPHAPDGFVVFSHAGDDPMMCRDYVRDRCGLPSWSPRSRGERKPNLTVIRKAEPDPDAERNKTLALDLWARSVDPRGTIVERYLAGRQLHLPDVAGDVLRFHPALRYQGNGVPGMVALLRDIRTDEPCGIHRTFLTADGDKLDRKMLGRAAAAAIKLDAHEDVTYGLTIGEGVETCLAARQIGFRPVWALGSVGSIQVFPVLSGIDALTILEKAGQPSRQAVKRCGQVWAGAGREVIVVTPKAGSDINDAVRGVA